MEVQREGLVSRMEQLSEVDVESEDWTAEIRFGISARVVRSVFGHAVMMLFVALPSWC